MLVAVADLVVAGVFLLLVSGPVGIDITEGRWSLPGAESVLKLRALISNGDFEPYFAWPRQREHQRNHQALYHDKFSLAACVGAHVIGPTRRSLCPGARERIRSSFPSRIRRARR